MDARRPDRVNLVVALLLAALAGVVIWDAVNLTVASYYGIGPKAMPWLVALGLVALAAGHLVAAFRGPATEREPYDRGAVLLILAGFLALIAIIRLGLGFIPATTVVFAAVATAFGRRNVPADLLIGLALAVLSYLFFTQLLTLSLPEGPIERLLAQGLAALRGGA